MTRSGPKAAGKSFICLELTGRLIFAGCGKVIQVDAVDGTPHDSRYPARHVYPAPSGGRSALAAPCRFYPSSTKFAGMCAANATVCICKRSTTDAPSVHPGQRQATPERDRRGSCPGQRRLRQRIHSLATRRRAKGLTFTTSRASAPLNETDHSPAPTNWTTTQAHESLAQVARQVRNPVAMGRRRRGRRSIRRCCRT